MIKQKKNSVMYSEIYDILNLLGSEYIDKIPYKFYQHIEESRDPEYKSDFILDDGMIDENKIAKETVALFTILNLKYFFVLSLIVRFLIVYHKYFVILLYIYVVYKYLLFHLSYMQKHTQYQ